MPILESSILFFQVFFGFTFGTSFVIDRNGYFDVSDNFDVPPSICAHGSTSQECEPFQANSLDLRCSCHCSGENATFIFHHSKWACLAHDEVRKLQGKTEILNEIDGRGTVFHFHVNMQNERRGYKSSITLTDTTCTFSKSLASLLPRNLWCIWFVFAFKASSTDRLTSTSP